MERNRRMGRPSRPQRVSFPQTPRYTVKYDAEVGVWEVFEDGKPLEVFCWTETSARAVVQALNLVRAALVSAPLRVKPPKGHFLN